MLTETNSSEGDLLVGHHRRQVAQHRLLARAERLDHQRRLGAAAAVAAVERLQQLADERAVRGAAAQLAGEQRLERPAELHQRPAQPGGLGQVERALERRRRLRRGRRRASSASASTTSACTPSGVSARARRPGRERLARDLGVAVGELELRDDHRVAERRRPSGVAAHQARRLLASPSWARSIASRIANWSRMTGSSGKSPSSSAPASMTASAASDLAAVAEHAASAAARARRAAAAPASRRAPRARARSSRRRLVGGPTGTRRRRARGTPRPPATSAASHAARRGRSPRARTAPLAGSRARAGQHGEVGDGDQHDPVVPGLGGGAARRSSCALGAVERAGPQLGDPEVDERERAQVGVDHARLERAAARQRGRSPARASRSPRRRATCSRARSSETSKRRRRSAGTRSAAPSARGEQLRRLGVVAAIEQGAGDASATSGSSTAHSLGQPLDQRAQRADLAAQQQVDPALAGQPRREVPGLRLDRVQQPAGVVAVRGEPDRGAPVQLGQQAPALAAQLGLQQLAEQRVIAVPLAAPVQRRQQQRRAPARPGAGARRRGR